MLSFAIEFVNANFISTASYNENTVLVSKPGIDLFPFHLE